MKLIPSGKAKEIRVFYKHPLTEQPVRIHGQDELSRASGEMLDKLSKVLFQSFFKLSSLTNNDFFQQFSLKPLTLLFYKQFSLIFISLIFSAILLKVCIVLI